MTGRSVLYSRSEVLVALERGGSVTKAAELLKVSRQTLYDYLHRYDIEVTRSIAVR